MFNHVVHLCMFAIAWFLVLGGNFWGLVSLTRLRTRLGWLLGRPSPFPRAANIPVVLCCTGVLVMLHLDALSSSSPLQRDCAWMAIVIGGVGALCWSIRGPWKFY